MTWRPPSLIALSSGLARLAPVAAKWSSWQIAFVAGVGSYYFYPGRCLKAARMFARMRDEVKGSLMNRKPAPEAVMTISLTPNEVIAVNGLITTYLCHLRRTGTAHPFQEMIHLLERFQGRLAQQTTLATAQPSREHL